MFLSMPVLQKAPFIRLLIPLAAGIILFPLAPACFAGNNGLTFTLAGMTFLAGVLQTWQSNIRLTPAFGILLNLCLISAGARLCYLNEELNCSNHFSHQQLEKQVFICAHLVSGCQEKNKSYKAVAQVDWIGQGGYWVKVSGNLLVHFSKSPQAAKLKYGQIFCACTFLKPIAGPPNPHMFDYRRYMARRNIFNETFLTEQSWLPMAGRAGNRLMAYCQDKRDQMLDLLKQGHVNGDAFAVGAALLLGYEDKLSADLLHAYAGSGVLHILSVSGLHVAVLFAVLQVLLFFLDKNILSRLLKSLILLTVLWMYAILTGLSPSVLRSAAMLSFVVMASLLNRDPVIYNSLAASAFCLLVINPANLFDVGFQLSYLAVFGIVLLHPILNNLRKPLQRKGPWLQRSTIWLSNQVWTLCCISLAAQLITFPLGLFYFHQFPAYFLLSNLIIIPLSSAVMYCGMACFLFGPIPYAGNFILKLFSVSLKLLNEAVRFFAAWPGAVLKSVPMGLFEILALYLLVYLIIAFIQKPKPVRLYLFLYASILFCLGEGLIRFRMQRQAAFIVYALPQSSAFDFLEGQTLYSVQDARIGAQPAMQEYLIQPNREAWAVKTIRKETLLPGTNSFTYRGKTYLRVGGRNSILPAVKNISYLIVSRDARFDPQPFALSPGFQQLIADGSCSSRDIAYWKNCCGSRHIPFWSVSEQGAFEAKL